MTQTHKNKQTKKDAEIGSRLITIGMINLQDHQGHMSALNQKQVDENIIMRGKVEVSTKGGLTSWGL